MDNAFHFNRSEIAKNWHARGFSCGLWIDHAGREWSYQAHKTDELFMLMSGSLELEMEGQTHQPSVGQEIRIPAGISHTIRNIGGKTTRWFYGQQQEARNIPQTPATSRERSFHPEVKRKRRPEKNVAALDVLKET